MTPKHYRRSLGTAMRGYRTVLSHELANNVDSFIESGNFTAINYQIPGSLIRPYIEIIPDPSSNYNISSSGVTSYSLYANSALGFLRVALMASAYKGLWKKYD